MFFPIITKGDILSNGKSACPSKSNSKPESKGSQQTLRETERERKRNKCTFIQLYETAALVVLITTTAAAAAAVADHTLTQKKGHREAGRKKCSQTADSLHLFSSRPALNSGLSLSFFPAS